MPTKLLLLVFIVCLTIGIGHTQRPAGNWGGGAPKITGSISGVIVDSLTGKPVEFATLLLKRLPAKQENGQRQRGPQTGRPQGDSSMQKMMIKRMTARLGRAPTREEIEAAKQRFASRGGKPAPKVETQVDGTITDLDGNFRFKEVELGRYVIEASFIGYQSRRIGTLTLTGKKPDANLNNVALHPSATLLETAEVVGEAELIENRVDKVVYNASQDIVNQGGDGADVLRRVPLLSVDLDGNVSLRGSDQVQILINGRPSSMFAGSVGEALQAMPSDEIEKVEVITSPGARFQGEGSAGIINIITKKGGLKGLTGNVRASIGTRSNNLGANLNYAKGRFGVNGGLGSRFSWNRPTTTSFSRIVGDASDPFSTLNQSAEGNSNWIGLNGNVGAFYDVNAYNGFTTSFRVRGRRRNSDLLEQNLFSIPDSNLVQQYTLDRENLGPAFNYDWTTDYKRKFEGEDHELNIAAQIGGSIRDQDYELIQSSIVGDFGDRDELGFNQGRNLEYTFQVDYQRPLTDKTFLETGAQVVLRTITSDYSYERRDNPNEAYTFIDSLSNIFTYGQDVYAGYVSLRQTFSEKLSAIAGLRYEQTELDGALEDFSEDQLPFESRYENWLPSASLQYKLSMTSSARLAYSRRIRRPGLRFINPFVDLSQPRQFTIGNPELEPEVSDQLELTTNARIGKGYFNLAFFYKTTSGEISQIVQQTRDGASRTTFLNLGTTNSYGSNFFSTYTIARVIKVRGGVNVERLQLSGTGALAGLSRSVWQVGANGSLTIELPKDITVESFGFYRAPRQNLQGQRASFSIWSIGAQKKLAKDRWRLGIRIVEPFSRSKSFPNETNGFDRRTGLSFAQNSNYEVLFRSFGLNANYRFGSLKSNRRNNRKSKINNNDVRDEGGGEF